MVINFVDIKTEDRAPEIKKLISEKLDCSEELLLLISTEESKNYATSFDNILKISTEKLSNKYDNYSMIFRELENGSAAIVEVNNRKDV